MLKRKSGFSTNLNHKYRLLLSKEMRDKTNENKILYVIYEYEYDESVK